MSFVSLECISRKCLNSPLSRSKILVLETYRKRWIMCRGSCRFVSCCTHELWLRTSVIIDCTATRQRETSTFNSESRQMTTIAHPSAEIAIVTQLLLLFWAHKNSWRFNFYVSKRAQPRFSFVPHCWSIFQRVRQLCDTMQRQGSFWVR